MLSPPGILPYYQGPKPGLCLGRWGDAVHPLSCAVPPSTGLFLRLAGHVRYHGVVSTQVSRFDHQRDAAGGCALSDTNDIRELETKSSVGCIIHACIRMRHVDVARFSAGKRT